MQVTHEEVFRQKKLPGVGQIVRSKKYGTLWRVMEKREIWQNIEDDPQTRMLPAIYLAYWKVQKGVLPGKRECCQGSERCLDMHILSTTILLRQTGR
jgi:hypothetical protein